MSTKQPAYDSSGTKQIMVAVQSAWVRVSGKDSLVLKDVTCALNTDALYLAAPQLFGVLNVTMGV